MFVTEIHRVFQSNINNLPALQIKTMKIMFDLSRTFESIIVILQQDTHIFHQQNRLWSEFDLFQYLLLRLYSTPLRIQENEEWNTTA